MRKTDADEQGNIGRTSHITYTYFFCFINVTLAVAVVVQPTLLVASQTEARLRSSREARYV